VFGVADDVPKHLANGDGLHVSDLLAGCSREMINPATDSAKVGLF
jgi:hypothetical protein